MTLTNDQYYGLAKLERWYQKFNHQIIEISGVVGTGVWETIQKFIDNIGFDPREIMYLSYDQKQVLEMAAKRYHAYYINGIIYNYTRIVDFDTIPVINRKSTQIDFVWKKSVRKKIDPKYRLIVVFDSILINESTLNDLCTFGLPIILIRDPMLIPSPDTFTFMRDPNIEFNEVNPELIKNPIVYFAHKVLNDERIKPGNYDKVSVVPKKQMNLYNLRSSDMTITMTENMRKEINRIYREKILKIKNSINIVGERMVVMDNIYGERLVNEDEKKIKIYLTKGLVGTLSKCNKHAEVTKYVPIDFKPDFYHESFTDLYMNRHYLNGVETPSRQQIPDDIINLEYAYALSVYTARVSHWNKVTMTTEMNEFDDPELQKRILYTGITKARQSLTLII